jgi:hypothetical protein
VQPSAGSGAQRSRRRRLELPKSAAPPNQDRWSNSHHGLAPDGGARRCLKCLVGDFAEEIFVGLVEFGGAVVHEITPLRLLMLQQFRQLGDVGGDPPGLVAGEELGRRPPSRLVRRRRFPSMDRGRRERTLRAGSDGLWGLDLWSQRRPTLSAPTVVKNVDLRGTLHPPRPLCAWNSLAWLWSFARPPAPTFASIIRTPWEHPLPDCGWGPERRRRGGE